MLLQKSFFHLLEFLLFYIINRKSIIPKIALSWQENLRYKRYFNDKNKKLPFSFQKKWFIRRTESYLKLEVMDVSRQECLDWFIIFSEKQLRNILKSYMEYYNNFRPH